MDSIRLQYPFDPQDHAFPTGGQAIAIGYFDGVHLGHREVIRQAQLAAEAEGIPLAVLTFDPHPREVLGSVKQAKYLTPLTDKLAEFERLGVQHTYILRFDGNLAALSPQQFVEDVLFAMNAKAVSVGFNFTFGHMGKGTADDLRQFGQDRFRVLVQRPFRFEGEKVSSTLIREKLLNGHIEQAGEMLDRPYAITGVVVHGDQRGRTIGFPTANIAPEEPYVIPASGVYAVKVCVKDEWYPGVMNIGIKPTFAGAQPVQTLEAHLFDFDRDIYGESVQAAFIAYLRQERKFASVDELVAQIRSDADAARELLARETR